MGDEGRWITVKQAAEQLGISGSAVRLLIRTGTLPEAAVLRAGGTSARVAAYLVDPRPELRDWRTVPEAAAVLGVGAAAVRGLIRDGELKARRVVDKAAANRRTLLLVDAADLETQAADE